MDNKRKQIQVKMVPSLVACMHKKSPSESKWWWILGKYEATGEKVRIKPLHHLRQIILQNPPSSSPVVVY